MKRREWWLDVDNPGVYEKADLYPTKSYDDLIHVCELNPGEIVISREEAKQMWAAQADPMHTVPGDPHVLTLGAFMYALFGQVEEK